MENHGASADYGPFADRDATVDHHRGCPDERVVLYDDFAAEHSTGADVHELADTATVGHDGVGPYVRVSPQDGRR
jgi:hypothetical protein